MTPAEPSGSAIGHQVLAGKTCRLRGREEAPPGRTDAADTRHRRINLMQGGMARVVGHRPFLAQPIAGLFDGAEFLNIALRRHNKGVGWGTVF